MATQALDFQFGTLPVDDYEQLVAEPAQQVSEPAQQLHPFHNVLCCAQAVAAVNCLQLHGQSHS